MREKFKSINKYDDKKKENPLSTFWEWKGCSFEQTWIPFAQRCFVQNLVEIGPVVLNKIFNIFIWTNLNFLHLRMLCAMFGWNWPSGSGEELRFLIYVYVFWLFCNYLPLEKGIVLLLKKLELPFLKFHCIFYIS